MINGDTSLQILHRAGTQQSRSEGSESSSVPEQSDQEYDSGEQEPHAISPFLEYEQPIPEATILQADRGGECVENEVEEYERKFSNSRECKLSFFFVLLVITGVGNILAAKLQAVSMYNYGVFLSLFSYVIYVPLCFLFIIPVARHGWFNTAIPMHHLTLPKRPFAIMGFLDCLAAVMQTFASIYLPGSLLVLLPQASIPLSILLSKHMLGERYYAPQYVGATIVFAGLLVVMEPVITGRHQPDYLCEAVDLQKHCAICNVANSKEACLRLEANEPMLGFAEQQVPSTEPNTSAVSFFFPIFEQSARIMLEQNGNNNTEPDNIPICQWIPLMEASTGDYISVFIWSIVVVLSCIPMTLSSVYKQIKLSAHGDLHPVFLIGWIGVFQFLFSLVSAPSVGWATGIPLSDLAQNILDGLKCYLGKSSVENGCHPDSPCSSGHAFLFVNLCLLCQAMYMLCMMFVLKYGSTSLLYLALTMMVPLGNLVFSLPVLRMPSSIHISDVIALLVIVVGLLLYRFGHKFSKRRRRRRRRSSHEGRYFTLEADEEPDGEPCHPLLEPLISYAYV